MHGNCIQRAGTKMGANGDICRGMARHAPTGDNDIVGAQHAAPLHAVMLALYLFTHP
jgi:hypothetical protein